MVPKSIKNQSKSGLGGSWAPRAPRGPKWPPKRRSAATLGVPLGNPFGAMLGQKTQKFDLEGTQKKHQLGHRFFIDFGASWTSFWEGFGTHVGLQEGLKIDVKLTSKFDRVWDPF